jgi:hypothetical protein
MKDIARNLAQAIIDHGLGKITQSELDMLRVDMAESLNKDVNWHYDCKATFKRHQEYRTRGKK